MQEGLTKGGGSQAPTGGKKLFFSESSRGDVRLGANGTYSKVLSERSWRNQKNKISGNHKPSVRVNKKVSKKEDLGKQ